MLEHKLLFMGLGGVAFVAGKAVYYFVVWNPLSFSKEDTWDQFALKTLKAPIVVLHTFFLSGSVLFAGMAGECFSIPMDLLTSALDEALGWVVAAPRHSFLSEYMVNLTLSGLLVLGCLSVLGGRFHALSGALTAALFQKGLTSKEEEDLVSEVNAQSRFDVRGMVTRAPLWSITPELQPPFRTLTPYPQPFPWLQAARQEQLCFHPQPSSSLPYLSPI
jgi:hypothetical protein